MPDRRQAERYLKKASARGDLMEGGLSMLDTIFILATGIFFVVGIFYVRACERLK